VSVTPDHTQNIGQNLRELMLAINRLEREITELVEQLAPQLLTEPGFGPLSAAKLVG